MPAKIFVTPHAVEQYRARVCRVSDTVAEHEIVQALAAPLFSLPAASGNLTLFGCTNRVRHPFLVATDPAGTAAPYLLVRTVGQFFFWREARPIWRAHGWQLSRTDHPNGGRRLVKSDAPMPELPCPVPPSPAHPCPDALVPYVSRYAALPVQPLLITAVLRAGSPVCAYDPIHLDNLLARLVLEEATGQSFLPNVDAGYVLPTPLHCLWRATHGVAAGLPLYASTCFRSCGHVEPDVIYWHKRAQTGRFSTNADRHGDPHPLRIKTTAGRWMERRVPMPVKIALAWESACVGNPVEVARLLTTCAYLGKKRSQGAGEIAEWRVTSLPECLDAREMLVREDGTLARSVPIEALALLEPMVPEGTGEMVGWTPPQWKPSLFLPGYPVGTPCN